MKITITKEGINKGSLYKLLIIGFSLGIAPFLILMGISASLSYGTFSWQDNQLVGWSALVGSILMVPVVSVIWISIIWFHTVLGLWIYKKFKKIEVVNESE